MKRFGRSTSCIAALVAEPLESKRLKFQPKITLWSSFGEQLLFSPSDTSNGDQVAIGLTATTVLRQLNGAIEKVPAILTAKEIRSFLA